MFLSMPKQLNGGYSPLYFLASLGAGGLAVTFFMYLFHWVAHPSQPVPVFEDIATALSTSGPMLQLAIVVAMLGIAFFAWLHYRLLWWNIVQLNGFKKTAAWTNLLSSNSETQLKAVPLTLAMAVNVAFILGLVFVPRLWSIVEYLFPVAIAVFALIGVYALKILGRYFGRVLTEGGFDLSTNNSFAQLLPAFALAMVAVGLAAPAALSGNAAVVGVAHVLATFFMVAAVVVSVVALVLGFYSMMQYGTAPEAAPTLMIMVPIMTVLGIAMLRLNHGLHVHFETHTTAADDLVLLTRIVSLQAVFVLLGLLVLKKQNYYQNYLKDQNHRSAGSYALVCPGVALSVMLFFFINKGLVATGLVTKFGLLYWGFMFPAIALQLLMIWLVFHLQKQHFTENPQNGVVAHQS